MADYYSQFEDSGVVGGQGLYVGAKDSEVEVADSSGNLFQTGTQITATAAELNKLDEVSATTTEINALDYGAKVTMGTDFMGDLLDGTTNLLKGEGSGTGNAVAIATGEGGNLSITTSSADAAHAANGSSCGGALLNWRADSGGLVMETMLQIDHIANSMIFVGFTDAIPSTVEAPIFLASTAIDSDAANACGIVYDTDGTTEQWCQGGVKGDTDTDPAYSGTAPTDATDVTLRVEVSATGGVTGYVDGVAIAAETANAITVTTPVTPIIFVANRTTASRVVLVDYLWVQANRR